MTSISSQNTGSRTSGAASRSGAAVPWWVVGLALLAGILVPTGVQAQCGTRTVSTMAQLRSAITTACVTTIQVNPGTYLLTSSGSGQLVPASNQTIVNAGGGTVLLDGGLQSRIFNINFGRTVTIEGLEITRGRVTGNGDGGGIRVQGSLTLRNSLLTGNTAGDDGGGLYQSGGSSLVMENVTVTGNTSGDRGGGVSLRSGARLTHVTISGNSAGREGLGVNREGTGSGAIFQSVIVWGNSGSGDQVRRDVQAQGVNVVQGGCGGCGGGNLITTNPQLGSLANNGGLTRTMALPTGSSAIDVSDRFLTTDQRGEARPAAAGEADAGAYEAPPPVLRSLSITPDGLGSPVQRVAGSGYTQDFTVQNTGDVSEDVDLVATVTAGGGSPFVSVTSLASGASSNAGSTLTLAGLASGASATVTVTYAVASAADGTEDQLVLGGTLTSSGGISDAGFAEVEFDCGPGTVIVSDLAELRAALANACATTIRLDPGTYDLSSDANGPIIPSRDIAFQNTGGGEVRLDGGGVQRVMEIAAGRTISLDEVVIQNGYNAVDGGGIENLGSLTITNSLLTQNSAGDDGAAIVNIGGSMIIRNTTFSQNIASDDGGAFQSDGGTVELTHASLIGNRAGIAGDETGGAFKLTAGATVQLMNSLLSDNFQGGGTLVDDADGTVTSNGGNLVETPTCGFCAAGDVINTDPGIFPLAFNSGNTRTHGLQSGSAAIDLGVNADGLATDQRGVARPEGPRVDAGAFERIQTLDISVTPDGIPTPVTQGSGTGFQYDFTVTNLSSTAQDIELFGLVRGPTAGTPFITFQSISGPGLSGQGPSTVSSVPASGSVTFQVFYDAAAGPTGQVDTLLVQGRLASNPGVVDFGKTYITPAATGVQVTPDGLPSPVQRGTGTGYTQDFLVQNTGVAAEDIDLATTVTAGGGSPFVTVTSLTSGASSSSGTSLTLPALGGGTTATVTVEYDVGSSIVGTEDVLNLAAALSSSPGINDTGFAEIEYICGSPTVTVSDLAELRAAVADSCVSTVRIEPGLYDLTADAGGPISLTRDLTFENTGGGEVLLDGGDTHRVFEVGGGIAVSLDGLTIQNGYNAVDGGGILNQGTLTITNSLITGNNAGDDGAGIQNVGNLIVRNSTFSGNLASDDGGAFQSDGGTVELTHVTVVGNRAGIAGDETGGAFKLTAGATVSLNNSILSDNFQGGGTLVDDADGTVTSNGGNLVEVPTCGFCVAGDVVNTDPGLFPLALNGGDTRTHGLVNGSPALDAAQASEGLPTDQRGVSRPEGAGFDIGAFERFQSLDISVTPDGLPSPIVRSEGNGFTYDFTVTNLSSTAQDIELFGLVSGPSFGTPFISFTTMSGGGITGSDPWSIASVPASGSVTFQVGYDATSGVLGQVDTLRVQGRLASNNAVVDFGSVEIEYFCDGNGSTTVSTMTALRAAVANSCIGTIGVDPGTYDLTSDGGGQLTIDRTLTLYNTGSGPAILDANGANRVMEVSATGDADITGLTLTGAAHTGTDRGAGLLVSGSATVRQSAIIGNSTTNDGGGVAVAAGGFLRIENSTVAGNTATDRGAGFDLEGTAELVHVTVAENSSSGVAGGINVRGGTTLLQNSIVADNSQSGGDQVVVAAGTLTSNGGNLVEGGYTASTGGDLTADPQLLPRALNGGVSESYELGGSSPALDEAEAAEALAVDQRGVARPQSTAADIGAYELVQAAPALTVDADVAAANRLPSNTDVALYAETFTVTNTGGGPATWDLIATTDNALVIQIDSVRGTGLTHDTGTRPDSARSAVVSGASTLAVTVWYTVLDVVLGEVGAVSLTATDVATPAATDSDLTTVTVVRPRLTISKTALVSGDTVPGSLVTYEMTVTNLGTEGAEMVAVVDSIPAPLLFQIGSATQTLPSGLTAVLEFADTPGAWGYTPQSEGCGAATGFDGCVRYIRWTLSDTLSAQAGMNETSFGFVSVIR